MPKQGNVLLAPGGKNCTQRTARTRLICNSSNLEGVGLTPDRDTRSRSLTRGWYSSLKLGLSVDVVEIREWPWLNIEEGVWELKEVEMLEWTYYVTLQSLDFLSMGGQKPPSTKAVRKAQGRRTLASLSSVVVVLGRLGGQACYL